MRLIDADALGMDMWIQMGIVYGEDIGKTFADIVRNAPTIDPIKHGEWIDHGTTCQRYECSICGDQHDWLILPNNINFCPNCGAKMDKGGDTE
jgi:hypothetical protein